ncbi:hypothetical protein GLE_3227 [Lysobacter enzymogenes]|uniref:Uncharacterized protein n=1 Tax=Lysobacter enzymogenes TaxID=69 RepID=A0A0S2DJJ5_LYSEN|nr:hypothetical protein GLE_3227 [Lysobacter enzymogenes]
MAGVAIAVGGMSRAPRRRGVNARQRTPRRAAGGAGRSSRACAALRAPGSFRTHWAGRSTDG